MLSDVHLQRNLLNTSTETKHICGQKQDQLDEQSHNSKDEEIDDVENKQSTVQFKFKFEHFPFEFFEKYSHLNCESGGVDSLVFLMVSKNFLSLARVLIITYS